MRVLILSQYFWPEPIPKPIELAQALHAAGDEVTVITGFPNYPTGRLYSGHRLALVRRERINGIEVVRTFEFPYHGTSAFGRVANYVSFMLSAPLGCLFAPKPDAIYVWHPPLTVGVAAWIIGRLRSVPFIYDVQDIWPEAAVLSGLLKPGRTVRWLSRLERFVYRRADHIITVTVGARHNLICKGVAPEKVTAMPHWFDPALVANSGSADRDRARTELAWTDRFIAMFAGNLGLVQGLDTIVRAADLLRNEDRIRIVFVGDGAAREGLVALVARLGLCKHVEFIERQPIAKMGALMAAADALLVHLKWSDLSNYVIPSKTLAYLASGKPILMAMGGAASDLVRAAGAGLVVPPEDPAAIAQGIKALARLSEEARSAMGKRGRAYLEQHLAKDVVVPRYRDLLLRVAAGRSCPCI